MDRTGIVFKICGIDQLEDGKREEASASVVKKREKHGDLTKKVELTVIMCRKNDAG